MPRDKRVSRFLLVLLCSRVSAICYLFNPENFFLLNMLLVRSQRLLELLNASVVVLQAAGLS